MVNTIVRTMRISWIFPFGKNGNRNKYLCIQHISRSALDVNRKIVCNLFDLANMTHGILFESVFFSLSFTNIYPTHLPYTFRSSLLYDLFYNLYIIDGLIHWIEHFLKMKINMLLLIVPPRNLKIALVAWFLYASLNSGRKNKTKQKWQNNNTWNRNRNRNFPEWFNVAASSILCNHLLRHNVYFVPNIWKYVCKMEK